MEVRRGLMMGMAAIHGKRYVSGQITLDEDSKFSIDIENVPFAPSYAYICFSGSIEAGTYRTFAQLYTKVAVNDNFPTGTIMMRYDTNGEGQVRYTYSYDATIPFENGTVSFSPRSTSFPWTAGKYEYMIIE